MPRIKQLGFTTRSCSNCRQEGGSRSYIQVRESWAVKRFFFPVEVSIDPQISDRSIRYPDPQIVWIFFLAKQKGMVGFPFCWFFFWGKLSQTLPVRVRVPGCWGSPASHLGRQNGVLAHHTFLTVHGSYYTWKSWVVGAWNPAIASA